MIGAVTDSPYLGRTWKAPDWRDRASMEWTNHYASDRVTVIGHLLDGSRDVLVLRACWSGGTVFRYITAYPDDPHFRNMLEAWTEEGLPHPGPAHPGAFLTGSRVYGTPRADSDLDLVVPVDPGVREDIAAVLVPDGSLDYPEGLSNLVCWVAGLPGIKLNLILTSQEEALAVWRPGTAALKARAPVTREEAKETFARLRNTDLGGLL